METRQPYPTDVSDEEWAFVAPYLTLMKEDAPQRVYPLREVFNGLRWMVRAGADRRLMPHDLPPWYAVYGQGRRWEKAGGLRGDRPRPAPGAAARRGARPRADGRHPG
jgi:transposase